MHICRVISILLALVVVSAPAHAFLSPSEVASTAWASGRYDDSLFPARFRQDGVYWFIQGKPDLFTLPDALGGQWDISFCYSETYDVYDGIHQPPSADAEVRSLWCPTFHASAPSIRAALGPSSSLYQSLIPETWWYNPDDPIYKTQEVPGDVHTKQIVLYTVTGPVGCPENQPDGVCYQQTAVNNLVTPYYSYYPQNSIWHILDPTLNGPSQYYSSTALQNCDSVHSVASWPAGNQFGATPGEPGMLITCSIIPDPNTVIYVASASWQDPDKWVPGQPVPPNPDPPSPERNWEEAMILWGVYFQYPPDPYIPVDPGWRNVPSIPDGMFHPDEGALAIIEALFANRIGSWSLPLVAPAAPESQGVYDFMGQTYTLENSKMADFTPFTTLFWGMIGASILLRVGGKRSRSALHPWR